MGSCCSYETEFVRGLQVHAVGNPYNKSNSVLSRSNSESTSRGGRAFAGNGVGSVGFSSREHHAAWVHAGPLGSVRFYQPPSDIELQHQHQQQQQQLVQHHSAFHRGVDSAHLRGDSATGHGTRGDWRHSHGGGSPAPSFQSRKSSHKSSCSKNNSMVDEFTSSVAVRDVSREGVHPWSVSARHMLAEGVPAGDCPPGHSEEQGDQEREKCRRGGRLQLEVLPSSQPRGPPGRAVAEEREEPGDPDSDNARGQGQKGTGGSSSGGSSSSSSSSASGSSCDSSNGDDERPFYLSKRPAGLSSREESDPLLVSSPAAEVWKQRCRDSQGGFSGRSPTAGSSCQGEGGSMGARGDQHTSASEASPVSASGVMAARQEMKEHQQQQKSEQVASLRQFHLEGFPQWNAAGPYSAKAMASAALATSSSSGGGGRARSGRNPNLQGLQQQQQQQQQRASLSPGRPSAGWTHVDRNDPVARALRGMKAHDVQQNSSRESARESARRALQQLSQPVQVPPERVEQHGGKGVDVRRASADAAPETMPSVLLHRMMEEQEQWQQQEREKLWRRQKDGEKEQERQEKLRQLVTDGVEEGEVGSARHHADPRSPMAAARGPTLDPDSPPPSPKGAFVPKPPESTPPVLQRRRSWLFPTQEEGGNQAVMRAAIGLPPPQPPPPPPMFRVSDGAGAGSQQQEPGEKEKEEEALQQQRQRGRSDPVLSRDHFQTLSGEELHRRRMMLLDSAPHTPPRAAAAQNTGSGAFAQYPADRDRRRQQQQQQSEQPQHQPQQQQSEQPQHQPQQQQLLAVTAPSTGGSEDLSMVAQYGAGTASGVASPVSFGSPLPSSSSSPQRGAVPGPSTPARRSPVAQLMVHQHPLRYLQQQRQQQQQQQQQYLLYGSSRQEQQSSSQQRSAAGPSQQQPVMVGPVPLPARPVNQSISASLPVRPLTVDNLQLHNLRVTPTSLWGSSVFSGGRNAWINRMVSWLEDVEVHRIMEEQNYLRRRERFR